MNRTLARACIRLTLFALVACLPPALQAALPQPRTGGRDGKPLAVLFVAGGGPGGALTMDPEVARRLSARGYAFQWVNDREPLTDEYLRQFNAVVLVGLDDFHGGGYYGPGGVVLVNTARNVERLQRFVADGGGLVVVPGTSDSGCQVASTFNSALAPWKLRVGWEVVRDDANPVAHSTNAAQTVNYSWTRAVTRDPRTEGVKALAYPTQLMRWDDIYPTIPLFPDDPAWTVLARGEPTSRGMRIANARAWAGAEAGAAPVLAAARESGKGRVAVVSLTPLYLLSNAFAEKDEKGKPLDNIGEATTGPIAGIAYERGDGKTPSDWGVLLENLIRWTAEAGVAAGFGGPAKPWESKLQRVERPAETVPEFAVMDWRRQQPPPTWRHHSPTPVWWRGLAFYDEIPDPMAPQPQRMNKLLIGARSAYSGGKGTVAEWAKATRAAGFDLLVFTERFEAFKADDWPKFMKECDAESGPDFACLYGLDIPDSYGNRFLLLGNINFPAGGMLTEDGKALGMTARLSLGFAQHIAFFHRPGGSQLDYRLARHVQGLTVFTYADVKRPDGRTEFGLADDGFPAYQWWLWNACNPVPIVCHELTDPAQVAARGTMGFHTIVPGQDALDARRYFRHGMSHYFENPHRYFITEGPILDGCSIFNKDLSGAFLNRDQWRATFGARSEDPTAQIREAVLFDNGRVVRRWRPEASAFGQTIDGDHGMQHHFLLVVTDSKGRRAISPHIRTVPRGYFSRCADRQNWFGAAGSYTGIWPSGTHGIRYIEPGVACGEQTEGFGGEHPLASVMSFPFASNPFNITRYDVESRYIRPITYGMDAWAIHNTESSRTYTATAWVGKWHDIVTSMGKKEGIFDPPMWKLTTVEAVLRTKVAVTPAGGLFPAINRVGSGAAYRYRQGADMVEGKLDGKAETLLDLPAGASVGEYLLLTPLTVSGRGEIGWRAQPGVEVPAGREWKCAYMYVPPTNTWRAVLGAEGETPWKMELRRGTLADTLGAATLEAVEQGVEGRFRAGGEVAYVPLKVRGLNAKWPAALWSPRNLSYTMWGLTEPTTVDGTQTGGFLQQIGVHEGTGYAVLDNKADAEFFAGNTLTATDANLVLAFLFWDAEGAGVEAHNPTDAEIRARVSSARAVKGKFAVETEVAVPPGGTVRVTLGK